MKKIFILFALVLTVPIFSFSDNALLGSIAPSFKVKAGDNQELAFDDVKGKVVVLFYETKDTKEKNRKLKDELNKFYESQPEAVRKSIVRLAVINCKSVVFIGAWQTALRENSQKEGMTIYGDWNGKMGRDYHTKDKESNFIIIDKKGVIRYYYAGQVRDEDFSRIKDLLNSLI
jgi:alkyl hydroperoxide reductase subunit AhpC